MPDVCDLSDGFNDLTLECARFHLRAARKLPDSNGACLNCETPVGPTLHFCCVECRDDFERIQAAKRRSGVL